MDGSIEQTLPSALRGLPVAWVLLDVRDETRVEDGFSVVPGVKSAVEIEMRAVNVQIRQSGHPLQGVQSLWQEYGIGLIHRRHRKRSQHESVIVPTGCGFLEARRTWSKPPGALDSGHRWKDAPRKIVRSAQTPI